MRSQIAGRPMLALAVGMVGGLAGGWALLLAVPFAVFRRTVPFVLVGLLLGLWRAPQPAPTWERREAIAGIGEVVGVPRLRPQWKEFELELAGHRWRASVDRSIAVSFGDRVDIRGTAVPFRDGLDESARWQGLTGQVRIDRLSVVGSGPGWAGTAENWRSSFNRFAERWMSPASAQWLEALCMNVDGGLDDTSRQQLRATGTVHIISASGLHVFVIAAFLMAALSLIPVPRPCQIAVVGVLLILYAFATGLNPPIVRSVMMTGMGLCAYLVRRDRDVLTALAVAAVGYLLWRPAGVYDLGFQLSFVTVGGLAMFGPHDRTAPKSISEAIRSLFVEASRASWVAFLASAPLVASTFGTVSWVTLPTNLLIGGVVPVVVVLGLAAHALSFVFMPLAVGLLGLAELLIGWIQTVVEFFGALPFAQTSTPAIPPVWVAATYVGLLMLWRERRAIP